MRWDSCSGQTYSYELFLPLYSLADHACLFTYLHPVRGRRRGAELAAEPEAEEAPLREKWVGGILRIMPTEVCLVASLLPHALDVVTLVPSIVFEPVFVLGRASGAHGTSDWRMSDTPSSSVGSISTFKLLLQFSLCVLILSQPPSPLHPPHVSGATAPFTDPARLP